MLININKTIDLTTERNGINEEGLDMAVTHSYTSNV